MSTVAAIDLGSNSLKLTIARLDGPNLEVLEQRADITRIGQDLDKTGRLRQDAMDRTFDVLQDMVKRSRDAGVSKIACVATAGMRGAENAPVFIDRVQRELDLTIEIIDGLREAELAYRAPAAAFGPGPLVVIDVGGRSTEIIVGEGPALQERVSLDMGAVRLTERFLAHDPPEKPEVDALLAHARELLQAAPPAPKDAQLIGVSGTILALMGVQMDENAMKVVADQGEGGWLEQASVAAALTVFKSQTTEQRKRGTIIPEGRADVIVAGCAVVLEVMRHYDAHQMRVTNRGVRFGVLAELAG